ncbi:MAG: glycoside-pentoside-hexuronide (GPH):cation symporter [Treponema sp.]|jgi:GPH family glycoside/pentoside/hexuronide:cation symporter/glucuronide carrier protein|nr:glycoside-pentoside-hexuronide (GPH):cation symporter [Treponema sp.]
MTDIKYSPEPARIGLAEKAAFGIVNIGNIPIQTLLNGFLMIFYTDMVGLNPAAIATMFLVMRVFDGINDPIMGFVIDHLPRTKMGRFRSYLLFGTVICCINFILVWFGPVWVPVGKLAIAYITYLLLGVTFDIMDIPLNSMIPAMTDSERERNSLSVVKGFCYQAGNTLFTMAAPLILASAVNRLNGFYALIFSSVIMVLVFTIIGVMGIKERIEPVNTDEKYKIKDIIPIITCTPVVVTLLTTLGFLISMIQRAASGMYFFTYILDNRMDVFSLTSLVALAVTLPCMAITGILSNRFGKKSVFVTGIVISGLGPLLRLFAVTNIPLIYIGTVLGGVGTGFFMTLSYGICADNVDYVEHTRGHRAEGALAAVNSFVAKAGMGIGGAIPGYVLAATGYVANQPQTEAAKMGIIMNNILIPSIIVLIAALVFGLGYGINREKLSQITASLRERRAAKAR